MPTLEHKKFVADKFAEKISQSESLIMIETTNMDNPMLKKVRDEIMSEFGGSFLHGKKKACAKRLLDLSSENKELAKVAKILKGDTMMYFHNNSSVKVVKKLESFTKAGVAKYGQVAMCDFTLEPQVTKLPAETTKYFQKLRVPTKLNRGTIEITNVFHVLEKGKPVTQAQIDILALLNIKPYEYALKVVGVYTKGHLVDPEVFRIEIDQITNQTVQNQLCLSHGLSIPIKATSQIQSQNVLESVFALALELSDTFEPPAQMKDKINLLKDPEALANLASQAAAQAPTQNDSQAKAAEAEEVPQEESEDASEFDMDF